MPARRFRCRLRSIACRAADMRGTRRNWPRHIGALGLLIVPGSCLAPAAERAPAPIAVRVAPAMAAPTAPASLVSPARTDDLQLAGEARQGGVLIGLAPRNLDHLTLDGRAVDVADDGRFLIAFDRDAPNAAHLIATRSDGTMVERFLPVAAGDWRIEHINAPYTGGAATSAEFARRRPAELAEINAARRTPVISDGWRQDFRWPVAGRRSGYFGSQRVYQGKPGSYHSGADIAAPAGTAFTAPADGVVTLAATSPFTLEGYLLIVDHGMGLSSAFLHCSRLDVRTGDRVVQGQVLGAVGQSGRATGPHMHWGMKWQDRRIDPALLAGAMGR